MPLTLARGMDAGAICTCSLPTAGLPRHPPLTLSLLPRIASPATGGGGSAPASPLREAPAPRPPAAVQPLCPARSRTDRPRGSPRGLPGPAARRDPKPGGGMPPLPRESHPGGLCSGVWQEHQLKKLPQSRQCLPWLGTRCGNASWLVLPRYRFCILTLLKKSVAKTNKNPKQLRGTTPMCLLLNLDADRTSLQCRKSNTASKGNIFLQLHC